MSDASCKLQMNHYDYLVVAVRVVAKFVMLVLQNVGLNFLPNLQLLNYLPGFRKLAISETAYCSSI